MAKKLPAMQWYPGDWRKDPAVQAADVATRGIWFELINIMWDAPERGIIRGSHDQIARLVGCSVDQLKEGLEEIDKLGIGKVVTFGSNKVTVKNRRMVREEKARICNANRQQNYRKRKGNNGSNGPVAPPSSSSLSSSSSTAVKDTPPKGPPDGGDPDDGKPKPKRIKKPTEDQLMKMVKDPLNGVPKFMFSWQDWIRHRKEIGHPLTDSTAGKQLKMLANWEDRAEGYASDVIDHCITQGWQGLFEPNGKKTLVSDGSEFLREDD